jgi:Protein of unknown function (DUF445)
MPVSPVSALGREPAEVRARRLAAARRRATALLAGVTVVFVAVTVAGARGTVPGYVQAGAEAAMIGGVADWFAVTALFRRPLGLPIPHTALVVERKDQFAAAFGQFVQENFLNADVLAERIRSTGLVPAWPPGWPRRPAPLASPVAPRIWWSRWPRLSAMRMFSACAPLS